MTISKTDAPPQHFVALRKVASEVQHGEQIYLETTADLESFLIEQTALPGYPLWLLAFEDYRVSWGYLNESGLHFSGGKAIEPIYLQELRLFGPDGELYLWRNDENFRYRLRRDRAEPPKFLQVGEEKNGYPASALDELPDTADEWQVLWGTQLRPGTPWPLVQEERGVQFAVPHSLTSNQLPLRLLVRHYLNYDKATGLAYYHDLRLVELRDQQCQPLNWI